MWRKIEGFLVNENGEVINEKTGNVLKPVKNSCGYYKVQKDGKQVDVQLLVAKAFPEICGEWYKGCQINHLDEDKSNNSAYNLCVVSPSQNCLWGTRSERKTKAGSGIKKEVYQYSTTGEFIKVWDSQSTASKELGINQTNISRCIKGVYKQAGGYKWSDVFVTD